MTPSTAAAHTQCAHSARSFSTKHQTRVARIVAVLLSAFSAALAVASTSRAVHSGDGVRALGLVVPLVGVVAVCWWLAVRVPRQAVRISPEWVEVRNSFRTRRYPRGDVTGAALDESLGVAVIEFRDGERTYAWGVQQARAHRGPGPADRVIEEMNALLRGYDVPVARPHAR